ncbi:MarR family winged helix-turn-helix transcriptional regulator [Pseudactinotalea sp. Z1732]|uniref:MarR family winged helix-turn-helix transcriptional regulator n=1 Tax=Micrococcales TaxID=85006 RepID=UPI003C7AF489
MGTVLDPSALAERLAEVYDTIGPLYRRASRLVERDGQSSGVSVGIRAVLDHLRRDGERTVPQLASEQVLSRQFVQRMVNDAVAAGYVELVDNPAHRRSSLVRLTPVGRASIRAVHEREHHLMSHVGGDLTDADLEATLRVLRHMLEGLERLAQEGTGHGGP